MVTLDTSDQELLEKVIERRNFFESVFHRDAPDDWSFVRDVGQLLVRIEAEEEWDLMGHALLTRACRHLGDLDRAREELDVCRRRVESRELTPSETQLFVPFLTQEEEFLSPGPP